MKFLKLANVVFSFAMTSAVFSQTPEFTLKDLNEEVIESMQNGSSSILKIQPGDHIPFSIHCDGDVISIVGEKPTLYLTSKETVFIKVENENLLFSRDGQSWSEISNFFKGQINASLGIDEVNGLRGSLDLDLNLRNKNL